MVVLVLRVVPGLLFLVYAGLLLECAHWAWRDNAERRPGLRDRLATGLFVLGHIPAALYFGSRRMDPFYVHAPAVLRTAGLPILLLAIVLLFASCRALRTALRDGHTLTTHGPYRYLRHPMYAALYLMGFGMLIVSANWLVGAAYLGTLTWLCWLRVPAEEDLLRDRFGEAYRTYAGNTDRLLPRAAKVTLGKRRVLAAIVVVAALGASGLGAIVVDGLSDELGKADVAVVLGSKVYANGEPGPSLKSRLNATIRLYREGWFPEVFVSGGVDRNGQDEAAVMRRYLVEHRIPAERVHADNLGVNTRATARNAAAFMRERGMDSAMVVTQFYHVPRAQMAMSSAGVSKVYGAHAQFFEWHDLYAVPRELAAIAWYRLRDK